MDPKHWKEHELFWENIHPQGSDEWINARSQGSRVTASNFSAAIGFSPYSNPIALACSIVAKNNLKFSEEEILNSTRLWPSLYPDLQLEWYETKPFSEIALAHMKRGRDWEDHIRKRYERENNVTVTEMGLAVAKFDTRIGCSPDGLVGDDGIVEFKCPNIMKWEWFDTEANELPIDRIPRTHYDQIQGNMGILNKKWCDYAVFCLSTGGTMVTERIYFDEEYWNDILINGLIDFLNVALPAAFGVSPLPLPY